MKCIKCGILFYEGDRIVCDECLQYTKTILEEKFVQDGYACDCKRRVPFKFRDKTYMVLPEVHDKVMELIEEIIEKEFEIIDLETRIRVILDAEARQGRNNDG